MSDKFEPDLSTGAWAGVEQYLPNAPQPELPNETVIERLKEVSETLPEVPRMLYDAVATSQAHAGINADFSSLAPFLPVWLPPILSLLFDVLVAIGVIGVPATLAYRGARKLNARTDMGGRVRDGMKIIFGRNPSDPPGGIA